MIWAYSVKENEFVGTDIVSLQQLDELSRNQWIWVDVFNPDKNELEILTGLIKDNSKIITNYKNLMGKPLDVNFDGCDFCDYEKLDKSTVLVVPSISLDTQMQVYPIVLAKKRKMIITWGEQGGSHSGIIKKTIKRLREGVESKQELNSPLVISVLFHEIAVNNSTQILNIRKRIDHLEEKALENGEKNLVRSIFSLKKMISNLYRLMVEEKDFMLDVDKSVIPFVKLNEKSKPIVDEAIEIIDREIDFLDSYSSSLDSILTLTDLASIHKVESSINYLTIVLVVATAILVIFELMAVLELA